MSGAVIQGVTVTLTGGVAGATPKAVTTDADGIYIFTGLTNGSYSVVPSLSGYTFTPVSTAVTINGANVLAINFVVMANPAQTYSISGKVTYNSSGLAGVTMFLGAGLGSTTTTTDGSYSFSGLTNGTFTITPSLSGYTFSPSNSQQTLNNTAITGVDFTATLTVVKPDPPAGLVQATINKIPQVSLTWSASTGADSYAIYYTTTTGTCATAGYTYAGPATGLAYTDTNLISGTTYCFAVTAKNSAGESGYSNITTTTILAVPSPLNAIAPSDTEVDLTWGASAGAVSYDVYTSTTSGAYSTTPFTATSGLNSTVTGLTYGNTYYFVVTAVNANGETGYSSQKGVYLGQTPNGLTALPGDTEATLDWNATVSPLQYNLYDDAGFVGFTSFTSFTATSLTNGSLYNFTVTGVYAGGESVGSNPASTIPMSIPSVTLSEPATSTVQVSWTQAQGLTGSVYEQLSPAGSWSQLFTGVSSSQTWTGAKDGDTYNFTVTAINSLGQEGSASAIASLTLTPDAPTGLVAHSGNQQAALNWIGSNGATSYNVYITTSTTFTELTTTPPPSYTVHGLTGGVTYYFTVTAVNAGGESGPYNQASTTPFTAYTYAVGYGPIGIAVDQSNNIWIANASGTTLSVITPVTSGTPQTSTVTLTQSPWALAIDSSNNVWVSEPAGYSQEIIGRTPQTAQNIGHTPQGVLIDEHDTIWYGDSSANSSIHNDVWNSVTKTWSTVGGPYFYVNYGELITVAGDIWLDGNDISQTSASYLSFAIGDLVGSTMTALANFAGGSFPAGMAVDKSGYVWVAENSPNGSVESTNGRNVHGLGQPLGIAIDDSGYVWVAGGSSGTVYELDPNTGSIVHSYPVGSTPWGIAIDHSGNVWITNGVSTVTEIVGVATGPQYFPVSGPVFSGGGNW